MKNTKWEAIHSAYRKMEELCKKIDSEEVEQTPENITKELINARSEIRRELGFLKSILSEDLKERDVYLVLFPIVAHFDEMIQTRYLTKMHSSWPLLQKELFQVENGGEMFFEILDDILKKPGTLSFIFEVYYFCIVYGFRGKYDQDPVRIKYYLKELKDRISPQEPPHLPAVKENEEEKIKLVESPLWYYLLPIGVGSILWLCFYVVSNFIY